VRSPNNLPDSSQPQKRRRGFVLSIQGWQRLQAAELYSASQDNHNKPYTLEQLSERTGLSVRTLTKIRRRQQLVDQPSLAACFEAFGLVLEPDDLIRQPSEVDPPTFASPPSSEHLLQAPLKGQLPVDSLFYIYRAPAETLLTREIAQSGALIRIKAPKQFGKTSLVARGLAQAEAAGYRTAVVSLQLADSTVFGSLSQFLRWLCAMVTRSLGLSDRVEEFWNPLLGGSYSCNDYFESYLLPAEDSPFLLVLDEVNVLFQYPEVSADFFGMLRAWHEQSRHDSETREWQKFRLVIVYSTEIFVPLPVHQSPFNVGLLIELSGFNQEQVQELVTRYRITPTEPYAIQLLNLLGGHPYLTQLALFHLSHQRITLDELIQTVAMPNSIFSSHFNQQFGYLEAHSELKEAMRQVVLSPTGVELYPTIALKLRGMGLIRFQNEFAVASCVLYQNYFAKVLGV
jgi:transcriptional regulator with XRE-family HTH domain